MNHNKVLVLILVAVFVFCTILLLNDKREGFEGHDGDVDERLNNAETKMEQALKELKNRNIIPDTNEFVRKSSLEPNIESQIDKSQWVPKSEIPPSGPRIDMSKYVLKSSIPPQNICPPQQEIDYSEYIKKSTLPPTQKCPPCVGNKVKVSAGLCKKPPPCPACPPCPKPKAQVCPEPKACPPAPRCPEPKACPVLEKTKCAEIKYIKVPTIITRTIKVDNDNKVISEEVQEEKSEPTKAPVKSTVPPPVINEPVVTVPTNTRKANAQKKCGVVGLNSDFKKFGIYGYE
tara:strand:- start:4 stop:870 length:867 start_codon:yes stop_codon:yes gene_type:complete